MVIQPVLIFPFSCLASPLEDNFFGFGDGRSRAPRATQCRQKYTRLKIKSCINTSKNELVLYANYLYSAKLGAKSSKTKGTVA